MIKFPEASWKTISDISNRLPTGIFGIGSYFGIWWTVSSTSSRYSPSLRKIFLLPPPLRHHEGFLFLEIHGVIERKTESLPNEGNRAKRNREKEFNAIFLFFFIIFSPPPTSPHQKKTPKWIILIVFFSLFNWEPPWAPRRGF